MGFSIYDVRSFYHDQESMNDGYSADAWSEITSSEGPVQCLYQIIASNSDSIPHVVDVGVCLPSTTNPPIVLSVEIPSGAGQDGAPAIDLCAQLLPVPGGLIIVPSAAVVAFRFKDAISTGKLLMINFVIGRF